MKKMIQIQTILLVAFFLSMPFTLLSQEEIKEKKVTVKTVKEVDGKKIVKDTTFTITGDEDVKEIVKQFTKDVDGDSDVMVDVMVDVDEDHDVDVEVKKKIIVVSKGAHDTDGVKEKKVIIIKDGVVEEHDMSSMHDAHSNVMKFKSEDGEEEYVIVSPHGKHKVVTWVGKDGEKNEFEYEFDMENLEKEMAELHKEMNDMQIMIIDEEGKMHHEMIELEHLVEMEHLEELEKLHNVEIIRMPEHHSYHGRNDFVWEHSGSMDVTDTELREAGVKNKPNRLELEEIDINNEDGVIDLSFSLKNEGAPKVTVYNVYGDKVFSGKPELMNGMYQVKMDLSTKQHGSYYLMIVVGDASKTLRLHL